MTECGPVRVNGKFDREHTESSVKFFQARLADVTGRPLVVGRKIRAITWGAMFGEDTVPASANAPTQFIREVLTIDCQQIGVLEQPF